jgi:hypothetical protein
MCKYRRAPQNSYVLSPQLAATQARRTGKNLQMLHREPGTESFSPNDVPQGHFYCHQQLCVVGGFFLAAALPECLPLRLVRINPDISPWPPFCAFLLSKNLCIFANPICTQQNGSARPAIPLAGAVHAATAKYPG